jgi:hypothetical protein
MLIDYIKVENQIKALISEGKIKSEDDLEDIPIDEIPEKYGLCIKDLICYHCYKGNNFTCKYGCNPE